MCSSSKKVRPQDRRSKREVVGGAAHDDRLFPHLRRPARKLRLCGHSVVADLQLVLAVDNGTQRTVVVRPNEADVAPEALHALDAQHSVA
jgi:hypothetical protein